MGEGKGDIIFGGLNPKVVFTEVINPHCGPCGRAINEPIPLLDIFPEDLQVRIRVTGRENDTESECAVLTHRLISYATTHTQAEIKKHLQRGIKI